jgi:carbamoyltransferase
LTAILGISAFYHDSAAALVVDGQVIAAAQEERFSRRKHDAAFPTAAIDYCLATGGLAAEQLDYVAYYEKPLAKFDRLMETHLAYAPRGYLAFRRSMPSWLTQKLPMTREIRRGLKGQYGGTIVYVDHHQSHAASAFFPSPFQEAAIVTVDGVGEWSTTTVGRGSSNRFELLEEIRFPHSLGLLYSAFTYYLGFRVNSGEYKVMGLAPYGQPRYADKIFSQLIDLKSDGSFRLDMSYFAYGQSLRMTSRKFHRLFGGSPRQPESELTERHLDLAASIQVVLNEAMQRLASHAQELTGSDNLVLAGGVALNCVDSIWTARV